MITIEIYNNIGKPDVWLQMWGVDDQPVSAQSIKDIFAANEDETDFTFNIHCDGGSVSEGLAIYDVMRTSGKNIYTNVDGGCHSMAVCLLLAAPHENRTANPNSRALIHRVYAMPFDVLNADDAEELANDMRREENAILDIYVDRTNAPKGETKDEKKNRREKLKGLMEAENELSAKELKDNGFISKINSYNTNFKRERKMVKKVNGKRKPAGRVNTADKGGKKTIGAKIDNLVNLITGLTARVNSALEPEFVNYDYTDAEGNVIFSTTGEEDSLSVGDVVTFPEDVAGENGDYELGDGRIVTIEADENGDFIVTAITEEVEETLEEENARLRKELENLKKDFTNVSKTLVELKNEIGSDYTPGTRTTRPGNRKNVNNNPLTNTGRTVEDIKAEARARAAARNGKKGGE